MKATICRHVYALKLSQLLLPVPPIWSQLAPGIGNAFRKSPYLVRSNSTCTRGDVLAGWYWELATSRAAFSFLRTDKVTRFSGNYWNDNALTLDTAIVGWPPRDGHTNTLYDLDHVVSQAAETMLQRWAQWSGCSKSAKSGFHYQPHNGQDRYDIERPFECYELPIVSTNVVCTRHLDTCFAIVHLPELFRILPWKKSLHGWLLMAIHPNALAQGWMGRLVSAIMTNPCTCTQRKLHDHRIFHHPLAGKQK